MQKVKINALHFSLLLLRRTSPSLPSNYPSKPIGLLIIEAATFVIVWTWTIATKTEQIISKLDSLLHTFKKRNSIRTWNGVVLNEDPSSTTSTGDFTISDGAAGTGRVDTALDVRWAGTVIGHRSAMTTRAPTSVLASSDKVFTILEE
jgi:hypothetical protein